jgi:hypothetical protein
VISKNIDGKLDLKDFEYITYGESEGLPKSAVSISGGEDEDEVWIWVFFEKETYPFNEGTQHFEKKKFFFDEFLDWDKEGSGGDKTKDGKIWFHAGSGVMITEKNKNGEYEFNTDTFKELKNTVILNSNPSYPKPDRSRVGWLPGPYGVFRYEGALEKPSFPKFQVAIRKMTIT